MEPSITSSDTSSNITHSYFVFLHAIRCPFHHYLITLTVTALIASSLCPFIDTFIAPSPTILSVSSIAPFTSWPLYQPFYHRAFYHADHPPSIILSSITSSVAPSTSWPFFRPVYRFFLTFFPLISLLSTLPSLLLPHGASMDPSITSSDTSSNITRILSSIVSSMSLPSYISSL